MIENKIPTLTVMCGLQCSGKTTWAKEYLKTHQDTKYISSDELRLTGKYKDNEEVFREFYRLLNENLAQGYNVIADATFVTQKSRRRLMQEIKTPCLKEIVIMATPYGICRERLKERNERNYPNKILEKVLRQYCLTFEVPYYEEGWFDIKIINWKSENNYYGFDLDAIQGYMDKFDQKNPYHTHTLGEHRKLVQKNLIQYCKEHKEELDEHLINTLKIYGEIHDIGKMNTQTFDDKGVAHYYGHANVGAYDLLCDLELFKKEIFVRPEYKNLEGTYCQMFNDIVFLENYHMLPFSWTTEKVQKRWKDRLGFKYKWLEIVNECDKEAC